MDPLMINALVAIATCLFFLIQGAACYREVKDEDSFFLYARKLPSGEYAQSFAAASTSLATVLFFFATMGVQHGVYILFAPLTYALGCYVYNKLLLPCLDKQGFFTGTTEGTSEHGATLGTTLGSYIKARYGSDAVKVSVLIVTIIGLASILLIELYVGVTIFSIYLKPQFVDLALVGVAFVVFAYTGLGGIIAMTRTDVVQLRLMFLSTIALLAWLFWESVHGQALPEFKSFVVRPLVFKGGVLLPYPLLFNILIVNLLLVPALLRTWQMAAASKEAQDVRKGIMNGVWLTVLLTTMFVFIGILFFRHIFPEAELSLIGMLNALHTSKNSLVSYILFPLFFAGCLVALLSTADSALAPIMQSLYRDFLGPRRWKHGHVLLLTAVLFIITILLYFIIFRVLGFDLIRWLFTIFSLLIVCSPSIIFAVVAPEDVVRDRLSQVTALVSIWGGFAIALALSLAGNIFKRVELVQLNSPLAALFACLCFAILWVVIKVRRR
jgi:Na+/proline symporter